MHGLETVKAAARTLVGGGEGKASWSRLQPCSPGGASGGVRCYITIDMLLVKLIAAKSACVENFAHN